MSSKAKKLRKDIESSTNSKQKQEKHEKMKQIKTQINKRIKEIEENKLERNLDAIENSKGDSTKYYKAMREIKRKKKVVPLRAKDETETIACTEEQQIRIITEHLKKMLAPESREDLHIDYSPHPMETPFTGEEIRKVVNKMKNEKSAGTDDLEVELNKYASTEIHNEIANIFNTLASTGEELQGLILGILRPLQKPGKEKGPTKTSRPIISLSIIRKILTICMLGGI